MLVIVIGAAFVAGTAIAATEVPSDPLDYVPAIGEGRVELPVTSAPVAHAPWDAVPVRIGGAVGGYVGTVLVVKVDVVEQQVQVLVGGRQRLSVEHPAHVIILHVHGVVALPVT